MMKTLAAHLRRHRGRSPPPPARRPSPKTSRRFCRSRVRAAIGPGQMAPMSLMTYQDVRPWARSIKQRVTERADAAVGHRSARRHPELQERSVAARRRDRDDRQMGRRRRADGQRRRHAEAARVRRCGSLAHRQAGRRSSPRRSTSCRPKPPTGGAATTSRPASPRIATSRRSRASRARPPSSTTC